MNRQIAHPTLGSAFAIDPASSRGLFIDIMVVIIITNTLLHRDCVTLLRGTADFSADGVA